MPPVSITSVRGAPWHFMLIKRGWRRDKPERSGDMNEQPEAAMIFQNLKAVLQSRKCDNCFVCLIDEERYVQAFGSAIWLVASWGYSSDESCPLMLMYFCTCHVRPVRGESCVLDKWHLFGCKTRSWFCDALPFTRGLAKRRGRLHSIVVLAADLRYHSQLVDQWLYHVPPIRPGAAAIYVFPGIYWMSSSAFHNVKITVSLGTGFWC